MPMRREDVAAALRFLQKKADLRGRAERAFSLDPQEQDLADIAVETGASFIPGVGPAIAARDVERARRADDSAGMAMAAAGAIPGGKLAGLLKRYDPVMRELDVYHGTPHKFPATEANPLGEFDASKIGTGEGAQAYGHGVYLAESPDVAKEYQVRLSYDPDKMRVGGKQINDLYREIDTNAARLPPARASSEYEKMALLERLMMNENIDEVKKAAAEMSPSTVKWFNKKVEPTFETYGALYKADLPDQMIDRMLDWDKPLTEQKTVLKALTEMANRDRTGASAVAARTARSILQRAGQATDSYGKEKVTGASLYDSFLADEIPNQAQRSQFLKDLGIPGIRYADAGSRGQGGSGTRNFVVFPGEEKKVRILERDGKKVAEMLQRTAPTNTKVEIDLHPLRGDSNTLYLSKIAVPEGQRGQGLGTKAMEDVIARADAEGKRVVLSPSTEYGATSVTRLKDFYKRFGFVENKGRNKNYAVSQTMYRDPKKTK
jgi:ribosomal protein S18 acetylase RimI-like enzyme